MPKIGGITSTHSVSESRNVDSVENARSIMDKFQQAKSNHSPEHWKEAFALQAHREAGLSDADIDKKWYPNGRSQELQNADNALKSHLAETKDDRSKISHGTWMKAHEQILREVGDEDPSHKPTHGEIGAATNPNRTISGHPPAIHAIQPASTSQAAGATHQQAPASSPYHIGSSIDDADPANSFNNPFEHGGFSTIAAVMMGGMAFSSVMDIFSVMGGGMGGFSDFSL